MIDSSLEHFYQRAKSEDPYFQFMKIEVVDLFPGKTHFKMFIEPDYHTNRRGIAHGAPLATMSDACMGWASRALGYHVVTIDLDISYVRPVPENTWVHGYGEIIHHGKKTLVGEVKFYDDNKRLMLSGKGTYWIVHPIDIAHDI